VRAIDHAWLDAIVEGKVMMQTMWWRLLLVVGIGFLLLAPASTRVALANEDANPPVLAPQSHPFGHSYGEWSAKWWQWALAQPKAVNPLLDPTGANCGEGQKGKVWFLAGAFGSGTANRTCTVPAGKALFYPLVNAVDIHVPGQDTNDTPEKLRAELLTGLLPITELHASIDGVPIHKLDPKTTPYRACAGGDASCSRSFSVTLPPDNVFGVVPPVCLTGCSPAVADGVYLMLAPLSPGRHIISFGGAADGFTQAINYTITVKGENER
jgi:hypothetical protein